MASSGGRRTSNFRSTLESGNSRLLILSCSAVWSSSKSETLSARASACAEASAGITLRLLPALETVQFSFRPCSGLDRSFICNTW